MSAPRKEPSLRLEWIAVTAATAVIAAMAGYEWGTIRREPAVVAPLTAAVAPAALAPAVRKAPAPADTIDEARDEHADWRVRWQDVRTAPRTARTEREMADLLMALAERDHDGAMALAQAEPNLKLRAELRNAALRGWAKSDPRAATESALGLREADRAAAIAAVLAGASNPPSRAAAVAADVCDRDPARAFEYSRALISALSEQGNFDVAVQFLANRPASPQRLEETDNAFSSWAEHRPAEAATAANALTDPELRAAAFRGAVVGWSHADPAGLADYALTLAPGESRAIALTNAVPRWVAIDPNAAAAWLAQREPEPDFDSGVAAVAVLPNMVTHKPDLAMSLAQSITEPSLRTTTVHNLAIEWGKTDAAAASRYVESSRGFSDPERALLLAEIQAASGG